jgi:ATP-dependent DNA ligase
VSPRPSPDQNPGAAATRSTTPSWTCPRRSRPRNTAPPSSRLKINGELVILIDGRLSFDALQRRLVTSPGKAHQLVASTPASYVAFDLLAVGGVDLRSLRWTSRRRRLESLAAWTPPLQLSLVTDDPDEAQDWFEVLPAMGVEGLVVKGKATATSPTGVAG